MILDLSTLVDRLTGRQVKLVWLPIIPCSPIFASGPVNPGRQVDRWTSMITHNSLLSYIYLRSRQPVLLSTCQPVLYRTNIGEQELMGNYMGNLPLDLSTLVDKLTGWQVNKYGIPIMHWYNTLDLSTLVDRSTGWQVDRWTSTKYP